MRESRLELSMQQRIDRCLKSRTTPHELQQVSHGIVWFGMACETGAIALGDVKVLVGVVTTRIPQQSNDATFLAHSKSHVLGNEESTKLHRQCNFLVAPENAHGGQR